MRCLPRPIYCAFAFLHIPFRHVRLPFIQSVLRLQEEGDLSDFIEKDMSDEEEEEERPKPKKASANRRHINISDSDDD